MDNYSKMEDIFKKKVEDHYEKYFNIDAVDENYEEKLLEGYDSLEHIVKYLRKRLNIKVDTLMSKIYITNRKKIQAENNQYAIEIKYKTQCLKLFNTMNLDTNYDKSVIIFNRTPYVHFKYIGITLGTYKIKIPDEYSFGIMYDFEEFPNKEYNYSFLETTLNITGEKDGDPISFTEDKYIKTLGDELYNEDDEGLFNIGPHVFEVQFYKGEIELEVSGDFGLVSYYFKGVGYLGGEKRFKFSDICLNVNG
jgi:hypothetical protein